MAANIKTVGVIGTGVIGMSWIGLFLAQGIHVVVSARGDEAKDKVTAHLKTIWPLLERGGLAPGASISNWSFAGKSFEGYWDRLDFVQENISEYLELKCQLIADIDKNTRSDVVIASSSSGMPSSTFIRDCKKNPSRVLIGHPFNPPHIMPLVEVVPNPSTADVAVQTALDFYKSIGKHPILVRKEQPGFIVNRIQAAVLQEVFSIVARGVASAKDIDTCMVNSLGPSWSFTGPFTKNALGGGGGPSGFNHLLEHIGPAVQIWWKDMLDKQYRDTEEERQVLKANVEELLKDVDMDKLDNERNSLMVDIFKARAAASHLI